MAGHQHNTQSCPYNQRTFRQAWFWPHTNMSTKNPFGSSSAFAASDGYVKLYLTEGYWHSSMPACHPPCSWMQLTWRKAVFSAPTSTSAPNRLQLRWWLRKLLQQSLAHQRASRKEQKSLLGRKILPDAPKYCYSAKLSQGETFDTSSSVVLGRHAGFLLGGSLFQKPKIELHLLHKRPSPCHSTPLVPTLCLFISQKNKWN